MILGRYRITFCALLTAAMLAVQVAAQAPAAQPEAVLHPADLAKILPSSVFFRGQSATTQGRNSGGVRYGDGYFTFATLVDNSGYSTGIQEKYQAYFISEVPLEVSGQKLPPGAYGVGFISGEKFVVMDLAANDLLQATSQRDAEMKRPVPLQVVPSATAGTYRLYAGRDYVEFRRTH